MTAKEYLTNTLSKFGVDESTIDLIIINQGIDADKEISSTDVKGLKMAMFREFSQLIPLANVTEGGYSISWNWEALRSWYSSLADDLGVSNPLKPKVKDRSNLW